MLAATAVGDEHPDPHVGVPVGRGELALPGKAAEHVGHLQ